MLGAHGGNLGLLKPFLGTGWSCGGGLLQLQGTLGGRANSWVLMFLSYGPKCRISPRKGNRLKQREERTPLSDVSSHRTQDAGTSDHRRGFLLGGWFPAAAVLPCQLAGCVPVGGGELSVAPFVFLFFCFLFPFTPSPRTHAFSVLLVAQREPVSHLHELQG